MPSHLHRVAAVLPGFVRTSFVLLTLGLLWACGRPPNDSASESAHSQNLPFDRQPGSSGISPRSIIPSNTKLPEGTPIPVRLQTGLSSASSHAGDTFNAVVDEPVIIDGETVVSRGTTATGRVLEVKAGASSRESPSPGGRDSSQDNSQEGSRDTSHDSARDGSSEPGYLRIVLVSLNVGGKAVAIETSSIFAKGVLREERNASGGAASDARGTDPDAIDRDKNKDIEFAVDRHLSFRLARAVDLQ
jgi:hypothetical protein